MSNHVFKFFFSDQGYDPFSPEVVRPGEQYNAEASDPSGGPALDLGAMELELVNRAIEAVRSEMEKDKKKLSQIGDQGYEPASSSVKASYKKQMASASSSHNAYDPGSYQMSQTADYNPTPRSNKYTLDSEANSHANSMEYVPTAISKPGVKKTPPAAAPLIPSTGSVSSLKSKYTVDNSKPSTDMEYDPLSNFSAKLVTKGGKDLGIAAEVDGRKRAYPAGWDKRAVDEEYVPTVKKPKQILQSTTDPPKYTASFTESDDESSGTEYRPTPVSRLLRRKSSVSSAEENSRRLVGSGRAQKTPQKTLSEGQDPDLEPLDALEANDKPLHKKKSGQSDQMKSSKLQKSKREDKESVKKSSSIHKEKKGSSSVEKTSKKPIQEGVKKQKSHSKAIEDKVRFKDRDSEGMCKEGKAGNDKRMEKMKGEKDQRDAKRAKTVKVDQSRNESNKYREQKNGKLESGGREKDKKKNSNSVKDKSKKCSLSLEKKEGKKPKAKARSFSHADLFGDESPEEEEEEEDDDDEDDERIVRKTASAFKRSTLISSKIKSSDADAFLSDDHGEDEGDEDDEGDVSADYTSLQVDVDYDSDPMEECLRIFNESKDVKTEDKGRQAKKVPQMMLFHSP